MIPPNPNPPENPPDSSPSSEPLTSERIASDLLAPLWRGISPDYKARYARNVWEQFENNVRSAAYTARLPKFVQRITQRLGINPRADDVARVAAVLNAGQDRHVLRALRDEAAYLVLLVRVENDERKEGARAEATLRSGSDIPQPKGELPL